MSNSGTRIKRRVRKSNHGKNSVDEALDKSYRKEEPWRLFRILAEFVDGFEEMEKVGPAVSIFGSARTTTLHQNYTMAEVLGCELVKAGYGVITGGGPGIMEAANKGAKSAGGKSIGLSIDLPFESSANSYLTTEIWFNYFFVRKVMFVKYASGFIVLPGGFGTLDEFFEALTLIQTKKVDPFPIVLMGRSYWNGLTEWMSKVMLKEGNIGGSDLRLFHITDDPKEAVGFIKRFYRAKSRRKLR